MSTQAQPHTTMPTPRPELTIIVAATNAMGIGLQGSLPWTGLRKEMAYFARVTKRAPPGSRNTVLMGRKTWESIPAKFRPLKDRTNVVLTSSAASLKDAAVGAQVFESFDAAMQSLEGAGAGRHFVIGGAQIYREALRREETRRILFTRILHDFECDVAFPLHLAEDGQASGWSRCSRQDWEEWTGESSQGEIHEEHGTKYSFEMWTRNEV